MTQSQLRPMSVCLDNLLLSHDLSPYWASPVSLICDGLNADLCTLEIINTDEFFINWPSKKKLTLCVYALC